MSGIDPECHPQPGKHDGRGVCANCFEDDDLIALVMTCDQARGCDFCGQDDAPTAPFELIAGHIHARLREFYGKAANDLPYEGREGGYQGWNMDTWDVLREDIELSLPRDKDRALLTALVDEIGDETWCEFDWVSLAPDDSLKSAWESFCDVVKYSRRFFFHDVGEVEDPHPDARSPAKFFQDLGGHIDEQDLIRTLPAGQVFYRARPRKDGVLHTTALALGPPPPELATQSNRMNPPGISMLYVADNAALATAETREQAVSVGQFEATREIRILDLADMPDAPGFFSHADRLAYYTLRFLRAFSSMIIQPVPRDDRVQIDYIPTQVFTEFLRDFPFCGGQIDGVRYRSATGEEGANLVLFATPLNLEDGEPDPEFGSPSSRWLRLTGVTHLDAPAA